MPTVRLSSNVLQKTISGGGQDFGIPARWLQTMYGPGWPIGQVAPPADSKLPRTIDYPISVNSTLVPRAGYGHMPFASLNSVYENVTEVKMAVSLIHRELASFKAHLVDKDGNEVPDHDFAWMCDKPDGETPHSVWMTRLVKSTKVYDAAAVYIEESHGQTTGLHYIDGSTLFVIVDEQGNVPRPEKIIDYVKRMKARGDQFSVRSPMFAKQDGVPGTIDQFIQRILDRVRDGVDVPPAIPAYTQVIKGTPYSWWSADQIWYSPQSRRMNSPYGDSFIEDAWTWIMLIVNLLAFELGHYRTGNMPEGFVTLPRDLFDSPDRILKFEEIYNARMTSNPETERNRLRMFPDGSHWQQTKKADWPDRIYDRAWKAILHSIGIPPSEFGDLPGSGLGGKGFKEGAASDLGRNTLNPHRDFYTGFFNSILDRNSVTDVRYALDYPMEEIDPDAQKKSTYDGMAHGAITLNDALAALGGNPVDGSMQLVVDKRGQTIQIPDPKHIANKHLIVAGTSIYVVEDMQTQNGMAVPTFTPTPGGTTGGTPVGPESAVGSGSHTPDDHKTVEKVLRTLVETGRIDSKFILLPAQVRKAAGQKPKDPPSELEPHEDPDKPLEENILVDQLVEPIEGLTTLHDIIVDRPNHEEEFLADPPGPFNLDERLDHISVPIENANQPVKKADATHSDGCMVAVMLPGTAADQLRAITDGLGLPSSARLELAQNMHVTLAMLPDANQAAQQRSAILDSLKNVAEGCAPLDASIQGYGVFNGSDGMKVLFALLDEPQLPFLRTAVCQALDQAGLAYAKDYGFVPHITMAYFPEDFELPAGFEVPNIPAPIGEITLAFGTELTAIALKGTAQKLAKHCGVCEEDDAYFGAPVSREVQLDWPDGHHANEVEIVAMCPGGDLPPVTGLWKPEGGERTDLQGWVGHPQYIGEEAFYLQDRSLGFFLVPVAYVAEADGEVGSVVYYTAGAGNGKPPEAYNPLWVERAAVEDYIASSLDRGTVGHNVLTHPDESDRPILIDNGLSFPVSEDQHCNSQFCNAWVNQPLSADSLKAIQHYLDDAATWHDILALVGPEAVKKARACAQELLANKAILLGTRSGSSS